MAVNLQKGQRVGLGNSMQYALVGLGWDSNKYDGGFDFDLDASAFLLGSNGKVIGNSDGGDDEQIYIDFTRLPAEIEKIAITVTIHEAEQRHQNFGQVSNAYVRVAKLDYPDAPDGETVLQFDLEEEFSIETALVVCEIYKKNGEWKFNAVAAGYRGGLEALCRAYGVDV